MTLPSPAHVRVPLWTRMLLGACAGVMLPVVVLVQAQAITPRVVILALVLGPMFGASFVYFLDGYGFPRGKTGRVTQFSLAGALAGGAATALAYDFGILSAAWNVAVGMLAGAALGAAIGTEGSGQETSPSGAGPRILSARSLFLSTLARSLADEVIDADDHLVVKRGGQEFVVPWDEIADIEESHHRFGEFITIHFSRRGPMGPSVTFCPPFRFSWFLHAPSPVAARLRARVAASYEHPSPRPLKPFDTQ